MAYKDKAKEREWRKANRLRINELQRANDARYRKTAEYKEYQREWRKANPLSARQKIAAAVNKRNYIIANKDKVLEGKKELYNKQHETTLNEADQHYRKWCDYEDALITTDITAVQAALQLGRTKGAIVNRRRYLRKYNELHQIHAAG